MGGHDGHQHDEPQGARRGEGQRHGGVEVGHGVAQQHQGVGGAGGPEEHPQRGHKAHGDYPRARAPRRRRGHPRGDARPHGLVDGQAGAVHGSPHHEAPRGAVPQAADEHGGEVVEIGAGRAAAVAAQGYVDIVAQPGGEGYVPAAPEVAEVAGFVGEVEVGGEGKAHDHGQADGHVGVAGEVAVDLHGVAYDAHKCLEAAVGAGGVEDEVVVLGQVVGHDGFLDHAGEDEPQAQARLAQGGVAAAAYLGQEVVGAHDGPGHQGGEEGQEEGIFEPRGRGRHAAFVHIYYIGH